MNTFSLIIGENISIAQIAVVDSIFRFCCILGVKKEYFAAEKKVFLQLCRTNVRTIGFNP